MITRFEKVEAQAGALNDWPRKPWHRHLVGPAELEYLFLMADQQVALNKENQQLKAELERLKNGTPTETPK